MTPELRKKYNAEFKEENYERFFTDCYKRFNKNIEFKVCETPVFIPREFRDKLFKAGEEIINVICRSDFKEITKNAIPKDLFVPGDEKKSTCIALDFGICQDDKGELIPQLIEMQGFPSLYAWQHELALNYRNNFNIPAHVNHLFNHLNNESYIELLCKTILGNHNPENVILLEIEPEKQKTWIDFYLTKEFLGIEFVSITDIIKEDKNIFYLKDKNKIQIHRIYNRIIFDELLLGKDLKYNWNLIDEVNVEWVCHPNWFFRISKYTLPFIKSKYVPETYFLNDVKEIPHDIENWVLKPLFSFAGHGVIFNVTEEDLKKAQPYGQNFILQRKVNYKPVIETLDTPAKCEIRLMYLWEENKSVPQLVTNLVRLSKGEMIGVDYNKNKTWVGGTVGFFE